MSSVVLFTIGSTAFSSTIEAEGSLVIEISLGENEAELYEGIGTLLDEIRETKAMERYVGVWVERSKEM